MSYSDILATTALVVSLLSVGWTISRSWRWDRPVIKVSGKQWLGGRSTADGQRASFNTEVFNTGNQSTQITAAFWLVDRGTRIDRIPAIHGGGGIESLFEAPDGAASPDIPFTLGRYESCSWDFEMSLDSLKDHESIKRVRPGVDFISRRRTVSAHGKWQPSKVALEARRVRAVTVIGAANAQ
ncbi:hypothetical protein [Arthrobacter sp. B10-11]|uniref:hypothetical protein n=1 Tax=Arthrobacter sp. B10-11 TaxID=3081160 RepID=UPI002954F7CA|nr:hypothetical protein [Arthrobacter sp. B10-11]MDV8148427.1 hypothetical protein [Arthrobacter sp. B10-11]